MNVSIAAMSCLLGQTSVFQVSTLVYSTLILYMGSFVDVANNYEGCMTVYR